MQLLWLSEKSKGQVKVINELPTVLDSIILVNTTTQREPKRESTS